MFFLGSPCVVHSHPCTLKKTTKSDLILAAPSSPFVSTAATALKTRTCDQIPAKKGGRRRRNLNLVFRDCAVHLFFLFRKRRDLLLSLTYGKQKVLRAGLGPCLGLGLGGGQSDLILSCLVVCYRVLLCRVVSSPVLSCRELSRLGRQEST
jgi:hypothetical protein